MPSVQKCREVIASLEDGIVKVANNQSYSFNGRTYVRANLGELQRVLKEWYGFLADAQQALTFGGAVIRGVKVVFHG